VRAARAPLDLLLPLLAAALASVAVVGADSRWLAAVGALVAHGHLPRQLPFAAASTTGWHDVPVLAELLFHWLVAAGGDRALVAAQVAAAAVGFAVLGAGLRRRAQPAAVLLVGVLALVGMVPQVVVVHASLFSLALFPVLLLVLHGPRQRLWLALPVLALWSNLHGAVLVGWALLVLHVVVERRDAWWVGALSPLAICLTPQLWHTPAYYVGVWQNQASQEGIGMWAPLGTSPLDLLLIAAAAALLFAAVAGRRSWARWEVVAVVVLAAATVHAARFGPWLLFVLTYPAAAAVELPRPRRIPSLALLLPLAATVAGVASAHPARGRSLALVAARTHRTVLAEPIAAEEIELAGGRIWVADPLDAFGRADQRLYLAWSEGRASGRAAVAHASLVLVRQGSAAARASRRDRRLVRIAARDGYALYRVVPKARR
jgi:hypothetical protein